ncbi:MAG: acyl-CoA dehydrogenase [Rhodobacteraceae bacterium]|nr:MAG: acyl-CoA dehydrogenase [Paracoccaceae bacterium]
MIPFKAPVEDILFSLTHVAGAGDIDGFDAELHREIAAHFAAFAEGELAPLNAVGDRVGARLENGRVRLPEGFKAAFDSYCEQGWPGLNVPEEFGGQGMGAVALGITSEIFSGANQAFEMTTGLAAGAVRTLLAFGTDAQKAANIPPLASGEWLSSMALTEPGAGSDLARIKCRAAQTETGWRIDGEKIFISGADHDLTEEVLHLVLARTGAHGLGGLSLFLCRSSRGDGTRNGVTVTRIEEKLGIHASPTCQLRFDNAEAELLGAEGQGLAAMFVMMNHARLSVALQGAAHCAHATAIARAYAEERIQGKDTPIAQHADVARMLDEMDILGLGARGIAHLALVKLEIGDTPELVEILTPIAKYFCTEAGSEAADIGIQVLGGYGFLEEYGMAQILRDARITRIYEGTNGIHALSLATRLVRMDKPLAAFDALAADCAQVAEARAMWQAAWADMREIADPRPLADVFMRLTAELLHQIVWVRIAENADRHPDPQRFDGLVRRAQSRFAVAHAHYNAEKGILSA